MELAAVFRDDNGNKDPKRVIWTSEHCYLCCTKDPAKRIEDALHMNCMWNLEPVTTETTEYTEFCMLASVPDQPADVVQETFESIISLGELTTIRISRFLKNMTRRVWPFRTNESLVRVLQTKVDVEFTWFYFNAEQSRILASEFQHGLSLNSCQLEDRRAFVQALNSRQGEAWKLVFRFYGTNLDFTADELRELRWNRGHSLDLFFDFEFISADVVEVLTTAPFKKLGLHDCSLDDQGEKLVQWAQARRFPIVVDETM